METSAQAYWSSDYKEFKNWVVDSKANRVYRSFAKNQFHRARRQHDKEIIERQLKLWDNRYAEYGSDWNLEDSPDIHEWQEHSHKKKVMECV